MCRSYRRRWEEKLAWYRANGILPAEEGSGESGTLIVTRDEANGSIDAANIDRLIAEILKREGRPLLRVDHALSAGARAMTTPTTPRKFYSRPARYRTRTASQRRLHAFTRHL